MLFFSLAIHSAGFVSLSLSLSLLRSFQFCELSFLVQSCFGIYISLFTTAWPVFDSSYTTSAFSPSKGTHQTTKRHHVLQDYSRCRSAGCCRGSLRRGGQGSDLHPGPGPVRQPGSGRHPRWPDPQCLACGSQRLRQGRLHFTHRGPAGVVAHTYPSSSLPIPSSPASETTRPSSMPPRFLSPPRRTSTPSPSPSRPSAMTPACLLPLSFAALFPRSTLP